MLLLSGDGTPVTQAKVTRVRNHAHRPGGSETLPCWHHRRSCFASILPTNRTSDATRKRSPIGPARAGGLPTRHQLGRLDRAYACPPVELMRSPAPLQHTLEDAPMTSCMPWNKHTQNSEGRQVFPKAKSKRSLAAEKSARIKRAATQAVRCWRRPQIMALHVHRAMSRLLTPLSMAAKAAQEGRGVAEAPLPIRTEPLAEGAYSGSKSEAYICQVKDLAQSWNALRFSARRDCPLAHPIL